MIKAIINPHVFYVEKKTSMKPRYRRVQGLFTSCLIRPSHYTKWRNFRKKKIMCSWSWQVCCFLVFCLFFRCFFCFVFVLFLFLSLMVRFKISHKRIRDTPFDIWGEGMEFLKQNYSYYIRLLLITNQA